MGAGHIECGGGYEEVGVGVLIVRLSVCSVGFSVVFGPVGKGAKAKGKGGKSQQGNGAKPNREQGQKLHEKTGCMGFGGGTWDIHGFVGDLGIYMGKSRWIM